MSTLKTLTVNGKTYSVVPTVPAASVTLRAENWDGSNGAYSQVVALAGVTSHTKVDLQPTPEQLAEFHHKVLSFVAENDGGVVTVYAIGDKPSNDHTIQITLTEVEAAGKIRGNTVGTTMPRANLEQNDPAKADYVFGKDAFLDAALARAKESGEFDGRNGDDGDDGKSAYEYAKEAGYPGTEAEFAEKLAKEHPGVTVKDYGAYGDGSADDTEAFQTALNKNRVVFVPRGTYKLSGELVIKDNGCLELSQDTVLEFTNTSGNCINIGMLSHLRGNHATIKVPYEFSGNVLYAYSNDSTSVDQQSVPPWSKWDPQWKTGRYVTDINITKADNRGFHYLVNAGECKGTAVYISAKYTTGLSTFMWGVHYSGLRIAGAFAYGIHAKNINDGWLHEMRIENAFIDACETGVCLEDCSQTYISATIQPRRGYTDGNVYFPYAKNGIKLVRSKNTDLSGSRVWDWQNADKPSSTENEKTTLYELGNEYQEIAMYGDCSGTIVNDFHYHSHGDTRNRIYSDDDHNLETMTILQEPIDRWFKVIGGEPYFTDGLTTRKLLDENALDSFVYVDAVKNFTDVLATATEADGVTVFNNIGYQVGKRFTSLGTGTDLADSVYYMTTGFIRVPLGSTIYGKGLKFDDTAKTYAGIVYYNDKYERVASMSITLVVNGNQYYVINYKSTGDGFSVQIPNSTTLANLNATYVRMVFPMTGVGDYPMLSIDNPIEYTMEGFLADGVKVKGENVIGNVGETTPDWVATKELAGGENTYIPEQTVSSGIWNKLQMAMQPGLVYDVTLNGEVYSCEARAYGSGVVLGNNTSLTLNDYPFCISWAGGTATSGMFFKNSEVISDPVKLKVTDHVYYVYDKMPEGYLPECVVKSVNGVEPDYYGNVDVNSLFYVDIFTVDGSAYTCQTKISTLETILDAGGVILAKITTDTGALFAQLVGYETSTDNSYGRIVMFALGTMMFTLTPNSTGYYEVTEV